MAPQHSHRHLAHNQLRLDTQPPHPQPQQSQSMCDPPRPRMRPCTRTMIPGSQPPVQEVREAAVTVKMIRGSSMCGSSASPRPQRHGLVRPCSQCRTIPQQRLSAPQWLFP